MDKTKSTQLNLMYHRIKDEKGIYSISPLRFKNQLSLFASKGVLPFCTAQEIIQGKDGMLLTFDDGTEDHYDAAEIVESLHARAIFFVIADSINKKGYLTTSQLRELYQRGHTIATHTHTHFFELDRVDEKIAYEEWKQSKDSIEQKIGNEVVIGSLPGGFYSASVVKPAHMAGIHHLFTSEPRLHRWLLQDTWLYGRFIPFASRSYKRIGKLAELNQIEIVKDKLSWNSKKLLKKVLRTPYIYFYDRFLSVSAKQKK